MDKARAELLRMIEFAGDQRLQLLVKHGFKDELLAALREQMDERTFYCEDHTRAHGRIIVGKGVDRKTPRDRSGDDPKLFIIDQVIICIERGNSFTLRGLMEFFDWDEQQLTEHFLREVFESTLKLNPREELWGQRRLMCSWEFNATIKAARHFLSQEDDLLRRVELWYVRARFLQEYGPFTSGSSAASVEWFLNKELPTLREIRSGYRDDERVDFYSTATDLIAERLRELGHDEDELAEDFTVLIERNGGHMQPIWTSSIVASNTLKGLDPDRQARVRAVLLDTLPQILDRFFFREGMVPAARKSWLRACGREISTHQGCLNAFEEHLTYLMAGGEILAAYEIVMAFGHRFGRFLVPKKAAHSADRWSEPNLAPLAAKAFDRAYAGKCFGNAALLVLVYGADACFDRELLRPKARKEAKGGKYKSILDEMCTERHTQIREIFGVAHVTGQTASLGTRLRFVTQF